MVTTTIFSKNNDVFRKRRYGEEGEKQPLHKIPRIITTRLTGGLIKGYKPILPASA